MASICAELVSSDEERDSRGRNAAGDARREAALAAYDRCGVTQREFACSEDVNYHKLMEWLERRHRETTPAATPPVRFTELRLPAARADGLEVCLPGGIVLRGHGAEQVAALVKALS